MPTLNDCNSVGKTLLPRLASLCWAKRQACLQVRDAAGNEKRRWELVVICIEEQISEVERKITRYLDVLKFKTKGEVF